MIPRGWECEPNSGRQREHGKEFVPEEMIVVGHIFQVTEQQAGPCILRPVTGEEAVAAEVDED